MARKITPEELVESGVVSAPDKLKGNPAENKRIFDRLVAEVVAPALNECVDAMENLENAQAEVDKKELQRQQAEDQRDTEERRRDAAEQDRVLAEKIRVYQEQEREKFEQFRYEAEQRRNDAEFKRSTSEQARVEAEQARVEAERERQQAVSLSEERLQKLEEDVEDLKYEPIEIKSFMCDPSVAVLGQNAGNGGVTVALSWTINKTPEKLLLDGVELEPESYGSLRPKVLSNKTWTLEVIDERGATDKAMASITFVNTVYYGAAELSGPMGSAFVRALTTKELTDTRKRTVTVNAAAGQHIWYAVPVRLGACTFTVGGFAGGFYLLDTVVVANDYGHTEPYYLYRSNQTGLGETTVEVS